MTLYLHETTQQFTFVMAITTKVIGSNLRASMVSTIRPVQIFGNTVIISMYQFMNHDLSYLILTGHVIAANLYPLLASVAAGGGAGRRPDEARPHQAPGTLHPLPQEPHRGMFERGADALDAFFVRHGGDRGALRRGLGGLADASLGATAAVPLRHFRPRAVPVPLSPTPAAAASRGLGSAGGGCVASAGEGGGNITNH